MFAAVAGALAVAASMAAGGCSSTSSASTTTVGTGAGDPVCTSADGAACPTGAGMLQLCVTGQGIQCTGAYMKVGSQTFMCNSCDDTAACNAQASAVCYGDGGSQ